MATLLAVLMSHIFKSECRHFRTRRRWIQIQQKRNKRPELLYEVKKICSDCGNTRASWFTEEQCKKFKIPVPRLVS